MRVFLGQAVSAAVLNALRTVLADEASRARMVELGDDAPKALRDLAIRCALDASAALSAAVTGRDLGSADFATPAGGAALLEAAHEAATATWEQVIARPDALRLLPWPVVEHATWAGPTLSGAWCTSRATPPMRDCLVQVAKVAGDGAAAGTLNLLQKFRWVS